jgi:mono/diheme cytochrome c family protein
MHTFLVGGWWLVVGGWWLMVGGWWVRCFSIAAMLAAAACGGAPAGGTSSSAPPRSSAEGRTSAAARAQGAKAAAKLNMDEIFPAGPGRELVLNNCQNCHTFVPIVILQMEPDAWRRNSIDHRDRVTSLSDDEFKTLYEYLVANFNPSRPVPTLPKELLETWTSY